MDLWPDLVKLGMVDWIYGQGPACGEASPRDHTLGRACMTHGWSISSMLARKDRADSAFDSQTCTCWVLR